MKKTRSVLSALLLAALLPLFGEKDGLLMEKIKVNGSNAHPLYATLTKVPNDEGSAGKITWNFEKFVIGPDDTITRFRPKVKPDDPAVIAAIEKGLSVPVA